jgi:hypothetical protein
MNVNRMVWVGPRTSNLQARINIYQANRSSDGPSGTCHGFCEQSSGQGFTRGDPLHRLSIRIPLGVHERSSLAYYAYAGIIYS